MTFHASPHTPFQIHQKFFDRDRADKVIGYIDFYPTHLSYGIICDELLKRQFVYTFAGFSREPLLKDVFSIRYWGLQKFYKKELEILSKK